MYAGPVFITETKLGLVIIIFFNFHSNFLVLLSTFVALLFLYSWEKWAVIKFYRKPKYSSLSVNTGTIQLLILLVIFGTFIG